MNEVSYTYSLATYFSNSIDNLKTDELSDKIIATTSITKAFVTIDTEEGKTDTDINIIFEEALSTAEETTLTGLVSSHTPLVKNDTLIFDAIVDSKYMGDYTSIAAAFADGRTSVYVRDGLYIEFSDIVIPDGGQLIGESQGNVKIALVAGNSVIVDGSNGVKETAGTVSVSNNSNTVSGTGTTFTNLSPGQFILLGTNYYGITSIETDTSLTLNETYHGKTLTDITYIAQMMYTGIKINNIIIANSSTYGLFIRGMRHSGLKGVAIMSCTPNVYVVDSGDSSIYEFICGFSNGVGLTLDSSFSFLLDTIDIYNSTGNGIEIKNHTCSNIFDTCSSCNNNGIGLRITDNSCQVTITSAVFKQNNSHGFYSSTTSSDMILNDSTIVQNNGVGVYFEGSQNVMNANVVENNISHGIISGGNDIITSTQIISNGGHGLQIPTGKNSNVISTNRIMSNTLSGIDALTDNSIFSSNIVGLNTVNGIDIDGSNNTISTNTIYSNVDGIVIKANSDNTTVGTSNRVHSNSGTGVLIETGNTNAMVSYNNFLGNTTTNYTDNGTATTNTGNKV